MRRAGASAAAALAAAILLAAPGPAASPVQETMDGFRALKTILLQADSGWLDTGIDVETGQVFRFRAEGRVTLQRGNPVAECDAAGLDLRSMQQPLPAWNLGALVGKVGQVVAVKTDDESGEQVRDEIVRLFGIGLEAEITMPQSGRLYLGVNETVTQDNAGVFKVAISVRDPQ